MQPRQIDRHRRTAWPGDDLAIDLHRRPGAVATGTGHDLHAAFGLHHTVDAHRAGGRALEITPQKTLYTRAAEPGAAGQQPVHHTG